MDRMPFYGPETAGLLTTIKVPTEKYKTHVVDAIKHLSGKDWDEIHTIYILSEEGHLLGVVSLSKLLAARGHHSMSLIMERPKLIADPDLDQEKVVVEAVKNNLQSLPVVDKYHHFLGVVTAEKIINVLHEEHLEDSLRFSGIRGKGSLITKLVAESILGLVKVRLPWIMVGLLIGLVASFVTSRFELSLRENIALVFFIPIIGYITDSVGTQTETIFIRSLTLLKFKVNDYIVREFMVGALIGGVIGLLTGLFAYLLSQSYLISLTVGLSLFISTALATVLACITPIILKNLGKDPAVGSGPFTTAVQYLISLTIYFVVASLVL